MAKYETIKFTQLYQNNENQIAISFKFSERTKEIVRAFTGVKWSKAYRTFYISFSKTTRNSLFQYFKSKGILATL